MPNLIHLTDHTGTSILVNADNITFIEPDSDDRTRIIHFSNKHRVFINQSISEIHSIISDLNNS